MKVLFVLITLASLLALYLATNKKIWPTAIFTFWAIVVSALSIQDLFLDTNQFPPKIVFAILPSIAFSIFLCFKLKNYFIQEKWLLAIHILRIPVEIGLLGLYTNKLIPQIMTFEGLNFDILSGIIAAILFVILYFLRRPINKKILLIWNLFGLTLLVIIVTLAFLSAPSPIQKLGFEQPNIAVLQFPFVLLPTVIVPIVFTSHMLSIKKLLY